MYIFKNKKWKYDMNLVKNLKYEGREITQYTASCKIHAN
jgi:hypothetical protein